IKNKIQATWAESLLSLQYLERYRDKSVDWPLLFKILNDEESSRKTSFIGCFKKKFKIKMLLQMLPTLKVVHTRIPDTYLFSQCFCCHLHTEDFEHLWLCPKNKPNFDDLITLHKS